MCASPTLRRSPLPAAETRRHPWWPLPASASVHSKPLEAASRFGVPAPPRASASTRRASWFTKASDSIHVVVESTIALDSGFESRLELAGLATQAGMPTRAASSEARGPSLPAHGSRLCLSAVKQRVLLRRVEAPCAFEAAERAIHRSTPLEVGLPEAQRLIAASIECHAPRLERRVATPPILLGICTAEATVHATAIVGRDGWMRREALATLRKALPRR